MNTIRKYHRRALCVRELLSSERSYVNSLKNVLEVRIRQRLRRPRHAMNV